MKKNITQNLKTQIITTNYQGSFLHEFSQFNEFDLSTNYLKNN
jgi:hypothetical protein